MTTLRSAAWDGPAPQPGDVVRAPDADGQLQLLVVQTVAEGPGPGQWRMDCTEPRIIDWRPATWRPAG